MSTLSATTAAAIDSHWELLTFDILARVAVTSIGSYLLFLTLTVSFDIVML